MKNPVNQVNMLEEVLDEVFDETADCEDGEEGKV
jgi:hypothetical protein